MANQTKNSSTWLLLLYGFPTKSGNARVSLWRKLKKFGAIQFKTSAYLLPDEPAHYERFQWLAKQIQDDKGEATLIRVAEVEGLSQAEIVRLFNQARTAEYQELKEVIQRVLARRKKSQDPSLEGEWAKQQRRFNEIRETDYFQCPAAQDVEMLLQRLEQSSRPKAGAGEAAKLDKRKFAGRIWMTRPRPGIDRAGSAWLITRFIDPKARFIFGMEPRRHPGALPFDMVDVEFSHQGEDCTFETLVKRFGITDKPVLRMAEMIHDADVEDGKFQRHECIGIDAILRGWARTGMTDDELLAKGIDCFEALYQQLKK
jgi:hypothetical protein